MTAAPLKTFIIYAHADAEYKRKLERFLRHLVRTKKLELWSDLEIAPGDFWHDTIQLNLSQAEVILMLVSVDFYNSDYIQDQEFTKAKAKLDAGEALLVPIIVRPCPWRSYDLIKDLQALPSGGKAIQNWPSEDEVFTDIAERLEQLADAFLKRKQALSAPPAIVTPTPPPATAPVVVDGMVYVEGGSFTMGSPDFEGERGKDETEHPVTLSPYYIGRYPVTIGEYIAFCDETKGNYPAWLEAGSEYNILTGTNAHYKDRGISRANANLPITGVSWHNAVAYCQWLSRKTGQHYRLPTEAEWEYAARGGHRMPRPGYEIYAGGNELDALGWYWQNSGEQILSGEWSAKKVNANKCRPHPVGQKQPNALGLYDMSGNVWEWCSDWYSADYYQNSPSNNPPGPPNGSDRVLRGGSWYSDPQFCRVAYRGLYTPDVRFNVTGFRLARTV